VEVEISILHTASNHGIESFNRGGGGGSEENEGMMIRRSSQNLQTLLLLPSPQPNTGFTEICSNQVFWLLQQRDLHDQLFAIIV
jgi:hypothetical protein